MGWLRSEVVAPFEPAQSARGFTVLDLQTKNVPLARFLNALSQDLRAPTGCTVPSKPSSYEHRLKTQEDQSSKRLHVIK